MDLIYQKTLSSLFLEEETLAKEFINFQYYDVEKNSAYWRAPILDLGGTIKSIISEAGKLTSDPPRRITLYCDTLTIQPNLVISTPGKDGVMISVYARNLEYPKNTAKEVFSIGMMPMSQIAFYTLQLPEGFTVKFGLPDGTSERHGLQIDPGFFGVVAKCSGQDTIELSNRGPPPREMEFIDYLGALNPDGTLEKGTEWRNDNLPRLLQFQFLVASTQAQHNTALALSLLNYICAATKESKRTTEFNIQASALLSSIVVQSDGAASYVPSVDVKTSKQVLKARLVSAIAFESTFRQFVAQTQDNKNVTLSAALLLQASKNVTTEYSFLEQTARKRFTMASLAYDKAKSTFEQTQSDLVSRTEAFKAGVQAWKHEQSLKAAKEIIFAAIEVIGAIGACVVAGPAGAPLVAGAATKVVKTGGAVASAFMKIKELVEKLQGIYEKIQPALEKLEKLVEAMKAMVSTLENAKNMLEMPGKLMPAASDSDAINGTAEWDIFTVDVQVMFTELGAYEIGGKSEYYKTLSYLPIYGKAFLAAQSAVIRTGDQLASAILRRNLENQQQSRIQGAIQYLGQDAQVLAILKRAMFDRLLSVRSTVFMDFWSYSAAYMYHSLSTTPPIILSATKPVFDYPDDAAKLQGALAVFSSQAKIQRKLFQLKTLCGFQSAEDLGSSLASTGKAKFSISVDSTLFSQFCRVRLCKARCYLEGLKSKSPGHDKPLQLLLRTETRFFDKNLPDEGLPGHLPRAFIGDSRLLMFEYNLDDGSIVCDGNYTQEDSYTKQTPFTEWKIEVGKGGISLQELDFSAFSGIKVDLWCDITVVADLEKGLVAPRGDLVE